MNRLPATVFVFCLALVPFFGCGGEDEAGDAQLTKKAFIRHASAVCAQAEKEELEGALAHAKRNPSSKEGEMVEPVLLPALEKRGRQIKALGIPGGSEAAMEMMIQEFDAALQEAKQEPKALLQASTNPFKEYNELAKKAGLNECGHVP